MKGKQLYNTARTTAVVLLAINIIAAIYGSCNLIFYPDGSSMGLDPQLLSHTPFHNYLVPGIILLLTNGVYGIFALNGCLTRFAGAPMMIAGQGGLLAGWLVAQMFLIRLVYPLHYIMGAIAICLILCGATLRRYPSIQKQ